MGWEKENLNMQGDQSHRPTVTVGFLFVESSEGCCMMSSKHPFPLLLQMRFLDCRGGRKDPSKSILDVGVREAICFSGFDEKMFLKRGGKYVWSKVDMALEW